jgi:aspartyl protease family protein
MRCDDHLQGVNDNVPAERRIGRAELCRRLDKMRVMLWSASALMAFAIVLLAAAAPAFAQTVLLEARDGVFRTPIMLNDKIIAPAMIDTGASSLGICATMAWELNLSSGVPVAVETPGGTIVAHRIRLTSVRIGSIVVRDVVAVVYPATPDCTEALVGVSVLKKLHTMILRGHRLWLIGNKAGAFEERAARRRSR